jgi:ribokinase
MRILNYGSLNIDHVYGVHHLVRPGETIGSTSYTRFCGGKGLNQSVALARAGAEVWHAGKIGAEGKFLKERLVADGVNVDFVEEVDAPTGHAVIQVDSNGENAIVIHGGANRAIRRSDAERVLAMFSPEDLLLLQNEISATNDVLALAAARGMRVAFNPAPFGPEVFDYPLQNVDLFILNETEGQGLTGRTVADEIADAMLARFPNSAIILTLGARGAFYKDDAGAFAAAAQSVAAVDTTAAGDTFIGFFLALYTRGLDVRHCLEAACRAATLCVTRAGAADAIPTLAEIDSVHP